jgi:hypothetical protein
MVTRFDAPLGSILRIPFGTYDSNGASVTMTGFTVEDIRIYKDGALLERGPDAGYTAFTDFDGLTGIHVLEIDTNEDDSPAGFWTVGSEFMVIITSVTVNSQTVRYPAAWFRLVAAETIAGYPPVDVVYANGISAPTSSGRFEVDVTHIDGVAVSTSTAQLGVNVVNAGGTAWASGSLTSGVFASGAITATAIAADAIGASELAADAVAEIADAVWDEDATAHQTQGTFGQAIGDPVADTNTIFKATVTDATGVTVGTDTATMLASGNPVSSGGITTASFAAGAIDAAAIAANAIGASELAADAATEIATAVWATATRTITALDEDSVTLDLDATIRAAVGLASANLDTQIGDLPTNAELATSQASADDATLAAIAALNNLSAAAVNAEVVDALATDTYAEPGQGNPAATTSLAAKINYIYKAWRNKKTQTSTTHSLYDDAGTTVDQKSTVSDDATTATRGEMVTGP